MLSDPDAQTGLWPLGSFTFDWNADELAFAALLEALVREFLRAQALDLESAAKARRSMADVKEEEERVAGDQLDLARRQLHAFREALADARRQSRADPQGEAAYDSTDPAQDAQADVLIRYLVRTDYGEVRTEEPDRERYIYHIRVAWDRLRQLSQQEGYPLAL